eukprot:gb/GFBE01044714.1/.p1 GENE.gb/GFBE01044714.1/~~gb/GFBE01044714.1/.p1  ORF type:complete len:578 (+),score=133.95 gb/GFBE01044714.1/:1-1734(+)
MQFAGLRVWCLAVLAMLGRAAKHSLKAAGKEGIGSESAAAFAMESKLLDIAVSHPALAELSSMAITTAFHSGKDPAKAEQALQQMESLILRTAKQKLAAVAAGDSEMDEAVEEIARIVEESLKTTIKQNLDTEQQRLDDSIADFYKCDNHFQAACGNATALNQTIPNASATHRSCRFEERTDAVAANECNQVLADMEAAYAAAKVECDKFEEDYPLGGRELCNNRIGNAGDHYLNLYEYWDQYLEWYDGNISFCRDLKLKVDNLTVKCHNLTAVHERKRKACNNLQGKLDTNSCGFVQVSEGGCEEFTTCNSTATANFYAVNQSVAAQEQALKQEWRAVLRIECLLDALRADNITGELIDACIATTYSLHEISINYTSPPDLEANCSICTNLTAYVPVTQHFYQRHFKDLPPEAPAELRGVKFCESKSGGTAVKDQESAITCDRTVIPTASMASYSSSGVLHTEPGLGAANSWAPAKAESGQSMTVELNQEEIVAGVFVQGGASGGKCIDSWVTTYRIQYSVDDIHYENMPGVLRGSHDCSTKVYTGFSTRIKARFVRFKIETWHGWASMRVGLMLC